MRKLVLVSALAIGLFSCQKQDSWCGLVVSKNDKLNSIVVKNSRTGELKTIYLLKAEYAKPNDKILDTHLGSGSIAIACHDYGFDLTACELDKEYFDKAIERITNHTSQIKLF